MGGMIPTTRKTIMVQLKAKSASGIVSSEGGEGVDFQTWIEDQASAIRSRSFGSIEWDGIAEELEAIAKREERDPVGHLKNLLVHLLKWSWQPARRSRSWENSIDESREQIEDLLADLPSLRSEFRMRGFIEKAYQRARRKAGKEMKTTPKEWERRLPACCPWQFEQFMTEDFLPAPARSGISR